MKKTAVIESLYGLAHDTRLDVFRLLVQRGPEGLAAGAIGERLKLPLPTLSFHLAQLKRAGLVSARRASRSIIYSANYKAMNDLLAYLMDNCCGGRTDLCLSVPGTAAGTSERAPQEAVAARRTRRVS
ncbi:MAG TPA: metalloregulator ArsR/SmtB family transcription factor [Candidatus Binataceae bacterium]|nr:metalloregulator ArsR/SmtB family transcription factor [Candidatus Binataceae bacterium]